MHASANAAHLALLRHLFGQGIELRGRARSVAAGDRGRPGDRGEAQRDLHGLGERPGGALNCRRPAVAQPQRTQLQHLLASRVLPPGTGRFNVDALASSASLVHGAAQLVGTTIVVVVIVGLLASSSDADPFRSF